MELIWYNTPTIICVLVAGYLAVNGITGWGWFLFIALLLCVGPRNDTSSDQEHQ